MLAIAGVVGLGAGAAPALAADDCANAEFRTGWSAQLPDCRAYELVTDTEYKGGLSLLIAQGNGLGWPTPSGEQVFWRLTMPVGTDATASGAGEIASTRGPGGWTSRNLAPASCSPDVHGTLTAAYSFQTLAVDLSSSLFIENGTPNCDDPDDQAGKDLYWVDGARNKHWVSQNGQVKTANVTVLRVGASHDLRHVFFGTTEKLVPAVDADRVASARGLYERVDGQTRAVGVGNDGQALNVCGAVGVGGFGQGQAKVSPDGRVVYFAPGTNGSPTCSVANGGGQIYARIDGQRTVHVSASQRTVPTAPTVAPTLKGTSADGRWAYFASKDQLTDDATPGGGLYRYDLGAVIDGTTSTGDLTFLTPQTGNPAGPNIQELVGSSEDGSIVYFTSISADLAPGVPPGNVSTLYRYDDSGVSFVDQPRFPRSASISKSGRWLVYLAGTPTQLYRYDGQNPGETVCVSCPPGPATGDVVTTYGNNDRRNNLDAAMPYVTEDGRAFFTSPDRLVTGDVNDVNDAYMYDGQRPRLLSAGTPNAIGSLLIGTANDGRDAFIATTDTLLPSDTDNGDEDIYVARIGGGFPQPAPSPTPCGEDACQGAVPAPAPGVLPTTTWFRGLGNVPAPVGPKAEQEDDAGKPRVSKVKTVRGTSTRIRVRVPGEGRIRTSGSGLRRSYKTAKSEKAKTYPVSVRLSNRAKRRLSRKGRVRVRVTVRFTPEEGKTTSTRVNVTFRKKTSTGSSRAKERSRTSVSRASGKDGR